MREHHVPVLVVGAGPVGLTAAMFLTRWGIRTLVIDQHTTPLAHPRASTSLRTLELLRSLGLGPVLDRVGWHGGLPFHTVFKDSALGATRSRSGLPEPYADRLATCSPIDARHTMTQRDVQEIARDHLADTAGQLRFGARLLDLDEDDSQVRARIEDVHTGELSTITADYLVAADGAHSKVREQVGITVPDRVVLDELNTAFFRADLGDITASWGTSACVVRNDEVYATLFSKNGRDVWSSHIMSYPGKPASGGELSEYDTYALLRRVLGSESVPIELYAVNSWRASTGIASRFRTGRVFLAGDAAHSQSSAGGLGMNTGIQDAHNLAWKLAAVLRGTANPTLLDSYETERRDAATASLRLSARVHAGYRQQHTDPSRQFDLIAEDYLRGMMFHRYRSPAIHGGPVTDPHPLHDSTAPGGRLPHRWLASATNTSTLDLVGTDWTVLVGRSGGPWCAAARRVAQEFGIPLRTHLLADTVDDGQPPLFGRGSELGDSGALLIRPDQFIAWRADGPGDQPERALRDAFGTILGRGDEERISTQNH